ncbi:MAG: twin-arginine translocase subunit TatC [Candidatus Dadabacteria bacterium]|nr:MAG: twin-arginine translocase subunit TatC [Candidatus Dadabacteria bacterium]
MQIAAPLIMLRIKMADLLPNSETSHREASELTGNSAEGEMSFLEHLGELRTRLIYSLLAIICGAFLSYFFAGEIFSFLAAPYYKAFEGKILIGTGPAEAFILKLKMALIGGCVLASPAIFYHVWKFVSPGMLESEKRFAVPFVVATTALFLAGLWFCYGVVLPFAFSFFYSQYSSIGIEPTVKISEHISFIGKALLAFAAIFELPVVSYFLARCGILSPSAMTSSFRYVVVAIFTVSAVLTPPDVLTQLLMALPLFVLYGISIVVVRFAYNKRQR